MRYAFAYGADAVYAGHPRFSLRVRNNEFHKQEAISEAIDMAHQAGKKFFIACNILAHNSKLRSFLSRMEPMMEAGPDALIMADPGLIMMVQDRWPHIPIHLSVQANTMSYATVRFWKKQGLARIILSRELSLEEIEEIRNECPDMELETFVHGSLCMAHSGRCLLSGYINSRDSNQGNCTNACRWDYKVEPARETVEGVYMLEQDHRPGEYMPVFEDEHGTYIMNSRDLRAVQHVSRLVRMGIDSLKIEGRTKSHYYVARTAGVYRQAIDDAVSGKPFDVSLLEELSHLANRGYTDGFYTRSKEDPELQTYSDGYSMSETQKFVGEVLSGDDEWLDIDVKNRFETGDRVQLIAPGLKKITIFTVGSLENLKGQAIQIAPGNGHRVRLRLPEALPDLDRSFALLIRHLSEKEGDVVRARRQLASV
ncbi:MAG: U32 family peptidase C-terminal domain-containing protein [Spirochaetales bacterium]|nr:U32 family peptidase C-terminal domain-containing protein [Spirochaetales bacterium]